MKIRSAHFAHPVNIKNHNGIEKYVNHYESDEAEKIGVGYDLKFEQGVLRIKNMHTNKEVIVFPSNIAYMEEFNGSGVQKEKAPTNTRGTKKKD